MIDWGLKRPIFVSGELPTAYSSISTSWVGLTIPNTMDGEVAKFVALWALLNSSPSSQLHVILRPGTDAHVPTAAQATYLGLFSTYQLPVVLDVSGSQKLYVRTVSGTIDSVGMMPIEHAAAGIPHRPLAMPPKIVAPGVRAAFTEVASAEVSVPNTADGQKARWVMVNTRTQAARYSMTPFDPALVSRVPMLGYYWGPVIFDVAGWPSIWFKRLTGSGTMWAHVSPVENH
jgi:hypothetical protein